ncbi:hypothetical protein N7541_008013 [Penicillium brevicompactum]|uniref:Uncharacterized protein n=1 Tax=Penicillium brevicompactum TaxID=5074 RepID=A0A9W9QYA1_PENBR|nr:uncharacterized protein N7506_003290 [Penicillium brevicompactum]KAJ5343466.1 hypothetical protein N7506_003290 [Penicillium brevicompactum]KAJ5350286.1 hypothetical protein N7541_008013 [Penicillium brevicompactum]
MDTDLLGSLTRRGDTDSADACDTGNEYDGRMGLRISSIFVIMAGSMIAAVFPVLAKRFVGAGIPSWAFFIAKYFGSGVIIATAFIHLLAPAEEALKNECLTGPIAEYSWVEGIILMTVVVMCFVELMVMRYSSFGSSHQHSFNDHRHRPVGDMSQATGHKAVEDRLSHSRTHYDTEITGNGITASEEYAAQIIGIFILEFGIIFHSIFIGLTLAVSGSEFTTLYIVLVFHQTFEGLGLGSRLATIPWPKSRSSTPYILGIAYSLTTPIAIAIGLGVRNTYPPTGRTTLIVNGVFDSISAGILIYTGLVELLAHEFMFSPSMRRAPIRNVFSAFFLLCLGAGLMAVLGRWA